MNREPDRDEERGDQDRRERDRDIADAEAEERGAQGAREIRGLDAPGRQDQEDRHDDEGEANDAAGQHADLLEGAPAQARIGLKGRGDAALRAQGVADELVRQGDRDDEDRHQDRDPDRLVHQEGGQRDVAGEHADDDGAGEDPAHGPQGAADLQPRRHIGAEALLGLALPRREAAQQLGEDQGGREGEQGPGHDRDGQGRRDGAVEGFQHLADDDHPRDGDREAHDAGGRLVRNRHQPPGGVVRRQDGVHERACEGHEGQAAQEGRDHQFQAGRDDLGRVDRDPDDPAARGGRRGPQEEDAERRQEPAAPGRVRHRVVAPDEPGRDGAPPAVECDRDAEG